MQSSWRVQGDLERTGNFSRGIFPIQPENFPRKLFGQSFLILLIRLIFNIWIGKFLGNSFRLCLSLYLLSGTPYLAVQLWKVPPGPRGRGNWLTQKWSISLKGICLLDALIIQCHCRTHLSHFREVGLQIGFDMAHKRSELRRIQLEVSP